MLLVRTILEKFFSIESSFRYSENSVYLLQFHQDEDTNEYLIGYVVLVFSRGKVVDCVGHFDSYNAGIEYFNQVFDLANYTAGWTLELKDKLVADFDSLDDFFVQHLNYLGFFDLLFLCKEDDLRACDTLRLCEV